MEEILLRQEASDKTNKMILIAFVVLVALAAIGYQYSLAVVTQRTEAEAAAKVKKIDGVKADGNGFTEMHRAADKGVEQVKAILEEHRKAINATDKWGETPLMKATKKSKHSTVQLLLENGADPNVINADHKTALYYALFHPAVDGNETALALLEGGADVNATLKNGGSLLHVACEKADAEAAELLLQHQVDIKRVETSTGRMALHAAAALKDADEASKMVAILLSAGAPVDAQDQEHGVTALHEAVSAGHEGVVQQLLDAGADLTIQDSMLRRTPLALARKKKKDDIVKLLEAKTQE